MAVLQKTTVVSFNGVGKPESACLTWPANGMLNGQQIRRVGVLLRIANQYKQADLGKYRIEFARLKYGNSGAWTADQGVMVNQVSFRSEPNFPTNGAPAFTSPANTVELNGKLLWISASVPATVDENGMVNTFPFSADIVYLDDDDGTDEFS